MIKAVLFDLDGLLADTEPLGIAVAIDICGDLGIDLTLEEQHNCIGVTIFKFYTELFRTRKIVASVSKVIKKHNEAYENLLKTSLKPFPGAQTLPENLKLQGYKLAIVSGSTKRQVDFILENLGLQAFFGVVVSFDDIANSKPDPEGFLKAAKSLAIEPQECVVLEDSVAGVNAAKSAGMKVVGIVNSGGQDLSMADATYLSLMDFRIELLTNF